MSDDELRAAATEYLGWLERRADKAGDHVLCWVKASALRAALSESCVECAEPSHDEDLHDHHYVNGVVHIGPPCAAALEPR